jgi:hypothetical protein
VVTESNAAPQKKKLGHLKEMDNNIDNSLTSFEAYWIFGVKKNGEKKFGGQGPGARGQRPRGQNWQKLRTSGGEGGVKIPSLRPGANATYLAPSSNTYIFY